MGNSIGHPQTEEENHTKSDLIKCSYCKSINMAEAAVLGMIQDLESLHVTCTDIHERKMSEDKIKVLKEILDFLRDMKMEERSKPKYLIDDLVELAQDVMDVRFGVYYTSSMHWGLIDQIEMIKTTILEADEKIIGDEEAEEEEKEVVVGLEENVNQLLDRAILKKSNDLQVFSIKGMIGIGKTTLARQLYNAGASQFQRHAWVCISSDMSNKEMLIKLIQQMVEGYERDPSLEEMDNRSLQHMLRQHLQGLSYFVVLDNMSNETKLVNVLKGLPSRGLFGWSILLLTSRYKFRTHVNYTHEMKALDSDKSWQLFLKTVDKFTSVVNKFTKELVRKGKEMLKKCGGLPIAIIDVARQKAKQRLLGMEWEQIFDSIDLSESLKILEPMYHELGKDIKPHFLYFSSFKENAIMREEKLEKIWAANGLDVVLVTTNFANRSILEVVKKRSLKRKCRLNPLLQMISMKKAGEEIGFELLRSNGNNRSSQNARHRVIHCGRDKFNPFTDEDSKQLISLIFHGGGDYLDDTSSSYWESFELLKILDMEDFGVKTLSVEIGALIELRYLGLRNNYIQEIPHSLVHLENLEVLDIALNFLVVMPNIIWQMGNLRDLHMSNVIFQKPLKVDALQNLENLAYISIYDWTYEDPGFETMFKFQTLGIDEVDENSDVGTLFATLAKIPNFSNLYIRGFLFRSMPCLDEIGAMKSLRTLKLDGRIDRLPSAENLPQSISHIALVNTCLDEDPMATLEKLSFLRHLKLRNAYNGREMAIHYGRFRALEVLCISELWNLRKIQVDELWNITTLEINNCPHLDTP